jgi:hypothetical protein
MQFWQPTSASIAGQLRYFLQMAIPEAAAAGSEWGKMEGLCRKNTGFSTAMFVRRSLGISSI